VTTGCTTDVRFLTGEGIIYREADHSHLSSAEVKHVYSCTSTPLYVFTSWCLDTENVYVLFILSYDYLTTFFKYSGWVALNERYDDNEG